MPSLAAFSNAGKPIKLMMVGHSGAGKTGALTSLVKAGYRLRIIDMDVGLDALVHHVKKECPDKLDRIGYMTFRDKVKVGPTGETIVGGAKAYVGAVTALDKWEDGGIPSEWPADGPDKTVVVMDSLTSLGKAAFNWAKGMDPSAREPRQWYFAAQNSVEGVIANLTSEAFGPNVIVMTHIDLRESQTGIQGFPSAIGAALGPKLPRYFNTLVLMETSGQGQSVKRVMRTYPTAVIGAVKVPKDLPPSFPIETGLADLFSQLRA